jgi:hypothetical protein
MSPSTLPKPIRQRIYLGLGLFGLGLALPTLLWLSFPAVAVAVLVARVVTLVRRR